MAKVQCHFQCPGTNPVNSCKNQLKAWPASTYTARNALGGCELLLFMLFAAVHLWGWSRI